MNATIGKTMNRFAAVALLIAMFVTALSAGQSQTGTISGTVRDAINKADAGKPHKFVVRARSVETGEIVQTVTPDAEGAFTLSGLPLPGTYLIELYDEEQKTVNSTEGPFALTLAIPALQNVAMTHGLFSSMPWWQLAAIAGGAGGAAAVSMNGSDENQQEGTQTICHHGANGALETMTVPQSEVDSHLAHGDTLGECPASGSR
jgi:hypothetical protein